MRLREPNYDIKTVICLVDSVEGMLPQILSYFKYSIFKSWLDSLLLSVDIREYRMQLSHF